MKHNNVVPNAHFHKDWQRFVRVWLNQPAKKEKRRQLRKNRAAKLAPRPLDKLRPIVRGQTIKYNMKVRAGRGFTLEELKAAGIRRQAAPGIGITVDHRRKNRSEEAFQQNVARLKLYRSKLVIFPRHPTSQRPKKGDSVPEERKKAGPQIATPHVLPIVQSAPRIKARKISEEEKNAEQSKLLRKARMDAKLWGRREKRAKDKREGKSTKKVKKNRRRGWRNGGLKSFFLVVYIQFVAVK